MKKLNLNQIEKINGLGMGTTCFFAPFATVVVGAVAGPLGAYNVMSPIIKACWNS